MLVAKQAPAGLTYFGRFHPFQGHPGKLPKEQVPDVRLFGHRLDQFVRPVFREEKVMQDVVDAQEAIPLENDFPACDVE